jgi:cysteinyl-tRNA synthetase
MPKALAVLWDMLKDESFDPKGKLDLVSDFDRVLGLNLVPAGVLSGIPEKVEALVAQRLQARQNKDWAASDRIRFEILAQGYVVEDTPKGQVVRPKKFGE